MDSLLQIFTKSYRLNPINDKEYFDCIKDFYYTDEFQSMSHYIQHGCINRIQHIHSVAYMSFRISKKLGFDYKSAARGALLHDLFYYDWHKKEAYHKWHGYVHPGFALENARILSKKENKPLNQIEENIIIRHMWPLTLTPPKYKEAYVVTFSDKFVATAEIILCKCPGMIEKVMGVK